MDGVHDLGGLEGFGEVRVEGSGAVAGAPWELRAQGLALLAAGESLRPHLEALPPATYLSTPYFARWLLAVERLLLQRGSIDAGDLDRWRTAIAEDDCPVPARQDPVLVAAMDALMSTAPELPAAVDPLFAVGTRVRVLRQRAVTGVSRCPRYVRGARGRVEGIRGGEVPLDRPRDAAPEPVYTVAFASTELWGPGDEPPFTVHVDLIEHDLTGADDD
ncbi:MAG: nitrile hydratase subunit beta [Nocardioidaceae bacterium]|nr:nitrile hydratase subunit beta [Nocardioidaceae bacterium]